MDIGKPSKVIFLISFILLVFATAMSLEVENGWPSAILGSSMVFGYAIIKVFKK